MSNSTIFDHGKIEWHSQCDASFTILNKLYGISKERKIWEDAQWFCKSAGDGLATFRNETEAEAFKNMWGKLITDHSDSG